MIFHLPFIDKLHWKDHESRLYNQQNANQPLSMKSGTNDRQSSPITNAIPSSIRTPNNTTNNNSNTNNNNVTQTNNYANT